LYVVVTITDTCNLACPYCYFFFGGDDPYIHAPRTLTMDCTEAIATYLLEGARALGIETIDISFHGGEPLIIGHEKFEEICQTFSQKLSAEFSLNFSIQTNAILINRAWVEIFSAYNVGIGVSLDGPPDINDAKRLNKKGKGSYSQTIEGIRLLQRAEALGLIPGFAVNCVITESSEADRIFDHFVYDLGLKSFDFAPPIMDWCNYDPDVVDFVKSFMVRIAERWFDLDDPSVNVMGLSNILGSFLNPENAEVWNDSHEIAPCTITIRSNGDVCPDDALTPKRKEYRFTAHNVRSGVLSDYILSDSFQEIDSAFGNISSDCNDCNWRLHCRGGRLENRFEASDGFTRRSTYCAAHMAVYETLLQHCQNFMEADVLKANILATSMQRGIV